MIFLRPEFLYALSLLSIPIIIHLFNFRRYKVVYFSQVKFLKNIQQKTKTGTQLKHLLVLCSRCLAIAALVFAFSQPFLPKDEQGLGTKNYISIYIDNSFSMQAENEEGVLFENAKNRAIAIVESFAITDKFQLLTNEFEGRHLHWFNRDEIVNEISSTQLSPLVKQLSQVLERIKQLELEEVNAKRSTYILSDMQKSSFDLNNLNSKERLTVVPLRYSSEVNLSINEIWFSNPYHLADQQEELNFKLNTSEVTNQREYFGNLYLNNQLKAPFSFKSEALDTINSMVGFKNSSKASQQKGRISIKDYPVQFDDTLYFSYPIQSNVNVLHIYEESPSKAIKGLFETDSFVNYFSNSKTQISYEQWESINLIVLDQINSIGSGLKQALSNFIEEGNSIVVFPSKKMELSNVNAFLKDISVGTFSKLKEQTQKVGNINLSSPLFQDVFDEKPERIDLPEVKTYRKIILPLNSIAESVLAFRNGDQFLTSFSLNGVAKVHIFSNGLNESESNLAKHALFVPMLYNMAIQSNPVKNIAYFFNSSHINIKGIEQSESAIHIVGNGMDVIPPQRFVNNRLQLKIGNVLQKAGHYEIQRNGELLTIIGLNYDRRESDLSHYVKEEIEEMAAINAINVKVIDEEVELMKAVIQSDEKGEPLWKYFIVLALLSFAVEMLLLRLMP